MPTRSTATSGEQVPPELVATVLHGVTVSDSLAVMVVESLAGAPHISWTNHVAVQLLGHAIEDLRALPLTQLLISLPASELRLLLRRERVARMTLPVRCASGELLECAITAVPAPSDRRWTLRLVATPGCGTTASRRCG
ncbi:hypothetical protein [Modestobacter sp. I12A-02662]|uniref:hypothetical protein n=1 Tax=Modestobacter sp. I12A-02662 TaxID=1730496 RepID=UPI0034DFD90F